MKNPFARKGPEANPEPDAKPVSKYHYGYTTLTRKVEWHEEQARALKELLAILYPNGYEEGRLSDDAAWVLERYFSPVAS